MGNFGNSNYNNYEVYFTNIIVNKELIVLEKKVECEY